MRDFRLHLVNECGVGFRRLDTRRVAWVVSVLYTVLIGYYYVGVRIFTGETTAEVIGFAAYTELEFFGGGDFPAYARMLDLLHPIDELLDMIPST